MFRADKTAQFKKRTPFFRSGCYFRFRSGRLICSVELNEEQFGQLEEVQRNYPVQVMCVGKTTWWLFRDSFYQDEALSAEAVAALVIAEAERKRRRVEKAMTEAAVAGRAEVSPKRGRVISREVRMAVWQRDQGKCAVFGSNGNLEFDHIVPFKLGGSNTERNVQLLCESCNRAKGINIGFGSSTFSPSPPSEDARTVSPPETEAGAPRVHASCNVSDKFVVIECFTCRKKLRVPSSKGQIRVRCPQCLVSFVTSA